MNNQPKPSPKYTQPIRDYIGRILKEDDTEVVDFVPQSHIRIWYNIQQEGYEAHHHSAAEIIYCVENLYPVMTENTRFNLNSGDILLIPPDMLHSIHGGEGIRFIYLIDLSPIKSFMDYNLIETVIMKPLFLSEKNSSVLYHKVREYLESINDTYFKTRSMWEINIFSDLLRMYAEVGKYNFGRQANLREDENTMVYYEKFANLLKYIDSHLDEELSLEWAADKTGFSKYYFLRLFKEYTGMTYYDHLSHKRIQAAQRLLSTNESITNIAIRTGFNNLTSFSRSFKKLTGISPSQYRSHKETLDRHGMSKQIIPLPAT